MSLFVIYAVFALCAIGMLLTCLVESTDDRQAESIRFIFALPIILIGAVCVLELISSVQQLDAPTYFVLVNSFSEELSLASLVQNLV